MYYIASKKRILWFIFIVEGLGIIWIRYFALKTEKWQNHTPASFIVRRPVPKQLLSDRKSLPDSNKTDTKNEYW